MSHSDYQSLLKSNLKISIPFSTILSFLMNGRYFAFDALAIEKMVIAMVGAMVGAMVA